MNPVIKYIKEDPGRAYKLVHNIIRKRVNSSEWSDIVQEALTHIVRKADKYDHTRGAISNFICTLSYNVAIDYVRKHNKGDFDSYSYELLMDDVETPEQQYDKAQLSQVLEEEIEKLSPRQIQVMRLRLKNKSTEEISDLLGMSEKTVYTAAFKAKEKLKVTLRARYFD